MRKRWMGLWMIGAVLVMPSLAQAQHARLVLFGDPDPAAEQVEPTDRFVHPLTAPYVHEDSFVTSDIRPWFVYHDFPNASAIDGGSAKVYAVQARLALTRDIQFVAYKDGYVDFDTGLVDEEGWNDLAAGVKWNFLRDWERQLHAAVGIGYELKTGDGRVLQNDDELRFWASLNKGFDRLHLGGTLNYFIAPGDEDALGDSDRLSWHLHADYYVLEWFSPVLELNGYHTLDEGNAVLPFQGVDVANLGGGKSEDVITIGLGGEVRPAEDIALRAAYETPLTDADDLFGYRWTFSSVFSF
ncbi:MAG: hypothetical protein ACODAQ_04670 [Phycisphaeraceae bacterium]